MQILTLFLVAVVAACASPAATAAEPRRIQPHADIHAAARAHFAERLQAAGGKLRLTLGRLDPRLRLVACNLPLAASQSPGARMLGASSVNVRCEGSSPWSIFVPVHVSERRAIVVTTRALVPGQRVEASDLAQREVWIADLAARYLEDPAQAIGKQVKRALGADQALPLQGLTNPRVVRRGAPVTLALERGPVAVRVSGIALQDGALGDRIQARNNTSRRVVEAEVGEGGILVVR
jgi:flagella basal body P-ring formation protein FlgA